MPNPLEIVGGIAIGEGVGQAVGDVVKPQLEEFRAEQWEKHPARRLAPNDYAVAVARSIPTDLNIGAEFRANGIGPLRQALLTQLAREYPGLPLALELWRRGYADRANVKGWLNRAGLSDEIVSQIIGPDDTRRHLFWERLTPQQVALGIVRSIIRDPGLMPVDLDTRGGKVPAYAVSDIAPLEEVKDAGIDKERLRVMVGEIGLPMSNQQAASALFRGIIELPDFHRAILEGDTRPEWAAAILAQARQILTANQYAELQLRGFLTRDQRRARTAHHGMAEADSDLLFDLLGRSVNVHQIVTGEARGGVYKPPPATQTEQQAGIPAAYLASLQRGNLRPEYYNIAYANRYTYPSFFAIRGLMQGGVLGEVEGKDILLEMGWKPDLAAKVAAFYAVDSTAAGTKTGPRTKAAQTTAITEIRGAFLLGQADEARARAWLADIGVDADEIDGMLPIWKVMLEVPQKGLTAAQIKKAARNLPAAWPRARALDELELLGYTADDAATILDE